MAEGNVGFEITVDISQAVKETEELSKKINQALTKDVKGKELRGYQSELKKIADEANELARKASAQHLTAGKISKTMGEIAQKEKEIGEATDETTKKKLKQEKTALQKRLKGEKDTYGKQTNYAKEYLAKYSGYAQKANDVINGKVSTKETAEDTQDTKKSQNDFEQSVKRTTSALNDEQKAAQGVKDEVQSTKKAKNTTGTKKQAVDTAKQAEDELKAVADKVNHVLSQPLDTGVSVSLDDVKRRLLELKDARHALEVLNIPKELGPQYNQLSVEIVKLEKAMGTFNSEVKKTKPTVEEFQNDMQSVINTTDRVGNAMRMDGATVGIGELLRRLEQLKQAKATLEGYGLPKEMDARYDMLNRMIAQTVQKINEYKASLRDSIAPAKKSGDTGKEAGDKTRKAFSSLAPMLKSIKSHFKDMSKASSRVKSAFNGMANDMKSNLKHMITNLTKYVLGFRSLFFLVRRLRKYIGEGIQNMAQYNDGNNIVNQSITRLLSSLLYLKNAWATAFSPILSVVTPLLENLIDGLARAGNSFSRFIGRLLGSGSVFQAVKVDAQDYAKSLDNASGSASGAADKTKKLTDRLAAFDDLNVLGKDDDPDGSGRGGGGGVADDYMPDPNEMFTILDVADDIKQKLMDIWNTEDMEEFGAKFKGLGETLASNLKQAFVDLNERWPEIQTEARKIGVAIGSFLSGLLSDKSLFEEAGKTVAESLDTIGQAISGFFDTYEKGSVGSSIASFFRGVFTNFDWGTAGANLGELVTTFFTEWATLMKEFPTEEFTNGLKEFFAGIDWSAVISSIVSAIFSTVSFIGKMFRGIGEALMEITAEDILDAFSEVDPTEIAEAFGDIIAGIIALTFASIKLPIEIWKALMIAIGNAWVDAMDDAGVLGDFQKALEEGDWLGMGKALVEGLGYGIVEAFDNAGQWVADYLVAPIVDNFKELFGIHSPSTVFEEFGINLIEGLKQGIEGLINSVMDPFNQLATDLFNKWTEIKGDAYEKWVGMKTSIKEKAGEIKTDVEEKFSNLKTNLVNKWQEIKGAIYEKLVGIKINMTDVFEQIGTAIKSPINAIIDLIEGMVNKCIDGINALTSGLSAFTELGSEALRAMNMPEIPRLGQLSHITIPHLAQGAVIPPNKEFMAVLGDQSHGTNIEAPLDTIKQALAEVLANNGNAEVIQLLQQLISVVESKNLVIGDKDIGKANARYVKQQNIVRGSTF